MDIVIPFVAWLLVWATGIALVAALPRASGAWTKPGAVAWYAGTGFFVGAFLLTLVMRVLSLAGVPFGRVSIAVPLLAVLAGCAMVVLRRDRDDLRSGWRAMPAAFTGAGLPRGPRAVWLALVGWLALRFTLLLADVLAQPLYPWDAWIQWATKARVWYETRALTPFAFTDAWLAANGAAFTDAAPSYPATVPLWQTATAIALGRFDDAWMNLPWWFAAVAFALAMFGALRRMDFAPLAALAGAWIVVSLPLADTHVALAGYADLPMAFFFALAALATLAWIRGRALDDALLAVLLVAACPLIKTPGIVWAGTLVPALLFALVPRHASRILAVALVAGGATLAVLSQSSPVILNYQLHLDFAPAWSALFESFFMLGNWNLLWYGVIAAAVLAGTRLAAPDLAPFTAIIAAGFLFLFVVFGFTNARAWVETQTTINRAILHIAPLAAVWMLVAFRAWSGRLDAKMATPAASPAAAPAVSDPA